MSVQLHATKKSKELSSADSGRIEIFLYARQLNDPRWCIVGRLLCHADVKSWTHLNVFYRQYSYMIWYMMKITPSLIKFIIWVN